MEKKGMTSEFKQMQEEFSRRLYRMPLLTHESFKIGLIETLVQRVPGGWVFFTAIVPVFVPWDDEFRNGVRTDI